MAVERLTDYTRRIWTALDADAPEGHDFEVGDVIYYMDSSQCGIVTNVYPDGSIDCETLPDVGGGGTCPGPVIKGSGTYTVTSNINSSIDIPISATLNEVGYAAISVMPPDSLNKTNCSAAWSTVRLSAFGFSEEDRAKMTSGIPRLMHMYNGAGTQLQAATTSNLGTYCILADDYFNPTSVTVRPYSSAYPIKPATYNWNVWGWE